MDGEKVKWPAGGVGRRLWLAVNAFEDAGGGRWGRGGANSSRLGRASLSSPDFARLSPERRQRVLCRHANSLRVGAKVETERKGEKESKKERG